MRLLFALALLLVAFLLLVRPAWAGAVRCTTYEEKTLGRLQTLCDDGTRATLYWSRTLDRWDPTTKQIRVRCRCPPLLGLTMAVEPD